MSVDHYPKIHRVRESAFESITLLLEREMTDNDDDDGQIVQLNVVSIPSHYLK